MPRSNHRPDVSVNPIFAREPVRIPRYQLAPDGLDPDVAYQVAHDELMLDGNPRLNLATFVTTWMEPQATRLMGESLDKNLIDKDEYRHSAELEERCVRMLAGLWHAPDSARAPGTSTTGSSEACMLAGLALKRRWQRARRATGKPLDRPNIVMGVNAHEVTRYTVFDVSRALREHGWLVPAYTFPDNRTDLAVLRIVVRNGFSHDLADMLVRDLREVLPRLERQHAPSRVVEPGSFAHGVGASMQH
jgi:glutamate/tyrosine decarboxylase-like PLP-dependent enzyme